MHVQALIMAAIPASGDITTGLVGWWKFDEGSGSTAADSSVTGLTGNLVNSPSWVTGKIGPYALSFNGSTNYVRMTSTPSSFDFANTTFTVSAWFKSSSAATGIIIAKGASASGPGWYIRINEGSAGHVRALTKQTTGGVAAGRPSAGSGYIDGNWHQVAAVIRTDTTTLGNNIINIYMDGVLDNGTADAQVSPYVVSTDDISVGARAVPSAPAAFLNGSVDDVRIYNRGLTALDIAALYAYR